MNSNFQTQDEYQKRSNSTSYLTSPKAGMNKMNMMSQTFARLPGSRVPQLDLVLNKINDNRQKQLKVLKANLAKKDRNQVITAIRQFKDKKYSLEAKQNLEDYFAVVKWKNEKKAAGVAQRKAVIEAINEKKRNRLSEKEQREMSPLKERMLKTFNA